MGGGEGEKAERGRDKRRERRKIILLCASSMFEVFSSCGIVVTYPLQM